jgi:hypothetical protein
MPPIVTPAGRVFVCGRGRGLGAVVVVDVVDGDEVAVVSTVVEAVLTVVEGSVVVGA